MVRLCYGHLFCGQSFFYEYLLVYMFFTRNNYPNCPGNFEGRCFKNCDEKDNVWIHMCLDDSKVMFKIIILLDISKYM